MLKGNWKISHLIGTRPELGDPWFEAWNEEDSMIVAWLWNSVTPKISDTSILGNSQGYLGCNLTNVF